MPTKVEMVKQYINNDEIRKALALAKTFKIGLTREERGILARGYECMTHRQFYVQLGMDPEKEIEKAIKVLERWK